MPLFSRKSTVTVSSVMTRISLVNLFVCRDFILQSLTNGSSRDARVANVILVMTTENWGFLRGLSGLGLIAVF
jgi:hypothetical protein